MVLFIFLGSCTSEIDQKKFEKVYRAAKTIQSATVVGVNYQKFSELLQDFSTELSITDDIEKSDLEKMLLKQYKVGLSAYQDVNIIWGEQILNIGSLIVPTGEIFVEGNMQAIVKKYDLKTERRLTPYGSVPFNTIPESSIQEVLKVANEQIDNANDLYNGVRRELKNNVGKVQ